MYADRRNMEIYRGEEEEKELGFWALLKLFLIGHAKRLLGRGGQR